MLYIVPTPIGNLEDMTFKAVRILKEVDLILAEDTRTSKKLLNTYDIDTPLKSYHAHNEHQILEGIVAQIKEGQSVALISDAGTPGISDPGFLIVRACHQHQIKVECLPGATAFVPALVASGIPSNRFHFEGFLPHKKGRQTRLTFLADLEETFVLYESPFRLVKLLTQLKEHIGPSRMVCVVRELTKIHEEIKPGTLDEVLEYYQQQPKVKGEIVVVVAGKKKD